MRLAPLDRALLSDITRRAKRCLGGKTPILVLYTHGTDYSSLVAIVRLADGASLGEGGSTNGGG